MKVRRSELKYYISDNECAALVNRLKHLLNHDEHSVPGKGYFVRSLYFDSFDNECLFEKQSGIMHRRKFRMRIYDIDSSTVKFEIKNKWDNQIFKETSTITRDSAEKIIKGDFEEFLTYNDPVLNKAYIEFVTKHYRPKVIVDYDRDAYTLDYFSLRITLDKNLRSNNTDFDLFSPDAHVIPVILEGKQILEIKYSGCFPDYVQGVVQLDSFERAAISKYTLGRRFSKTQNWEDN